MPHWTEVLSLLPYNIKTGTATLLEVTEGTPSCIIRGLHYATDEYTVSITPKFQTYVVPYVTHVTNNSFKLNGDPGDYFWTTISTS
jgi:hypothetical protein